jgi:hypothetical protein
MDKFGRLYRLISVLALVATGGLLLARPTFAPMATRVMLLVAIWPIALSWEKARSTALRPAIVWACVAFACAVVSQATAWREPLATGRPIAGHWTYLSTLSVLAALISVLNARRPGGGVWAILMGLLVLVLLIPCLEAGGLARNADPLQRLRLQAPWTFFYGLLVVAGVTNYLPTRYGPAAAVLGGGLVLEYLALTRPEWSRETRGLVWSWVPWLLAASVVVANVCVRRAAPERDSSDRLWIWFRDHWGVVWALRTRDRFNESARALNWPVRLDWRGLHPIGEASDVFDATVVESTLKSLLRRFADRERLDAVASAPCDSGRSNGS